MSGSCCTSLSCIVVSYLVYANSSFLESETSLHWLWKAYCPEAFPWLTSMRNRHRITTMCLTPWTMQYACADEHLMHMSCYTLVGLKHLWTGCEASCAAAAYCCCCCWLVSPQQLVYVHALLILRDGLISTLPWQLRGFHAGAVRLNNLLLPAGGSAVIYLLPSCSWNYDCNMHLGITCAFRLSKVCQAERHTTQSTRLGSVASMATTHASTVN